MFGFSKSLKRNYSMKICPNCGEELKSLENFCPYCGHSFTGEKRFLNEEDVSPVELILLCCFCTPLGALIYYLASKKK
ncbi:MAG: zinc ribbon domain-containing protein [Candidatus Hodarchaeales archaeon]